MDPGAKRLFKGPKGPKGPWGPERSDFLKGPKVPKGPWGPERIYFFKGPEGPWGPERSDFFAQITDLHFSIPTSLNISGKLAEPLEKKAL